MSEFIGFFTSLGQEAFNYMVTLGLVSLAFYSIQTRQKLREAILHSEITDVKMASDIGTLESVLLAKIETLESNVLKEIEKLLREQNQHMANVLAELK